jgi:hypothetical protein
MVEWLYLCPKDRGFIFNGVFKGFSFKDELQHGVVHDEAEEFAIII